MDNQIDRQPGGQIYEYISIYTDREIDRQIDKSERILCISSGKVEES